MSKVASALLSGKYAAPIPSEEKTPAKGDGGDEKKPEADENLVMVAPRMLKHLVGRGHAEFSTGMQQDAAEYMQHLLEVGGGGAIFFFFLIFVLVTLTVTSKGTSF